ncbi:AAA-ATPase of VPS4/SKD1 family [Haematococcus lacustris]|uniref:AAA-ATPase of VPS4/SKD1 family n=1 Tax=Haematococcus lacustris TaxID=44745 RepID=A0A699Z8H3_HAELA|nr:AAA-ATPase of VPS4/SKD1 family [Haematococcus lacustris]
MYVTFKEKGIDYAKQAVTEDEAGNHEEAMKMYMTSLEYFKTYLKYEKNVKAREAITGKDDKEKDKMKASLTGAILLEKPNVKWDDVAGLEGAKEALKEAVILPVKFPQFFTGQPPQ